MASGLLLLVAAVLTAAPAPASPASMPASAPQRALTTAPAEDDGVAGAIAKAPNANAAGAAYMAARNLDRSSPKIPHAYVQRLLEMGKPQLAATAAADLVELDPKDALGQGVIGYLAASKGNISKALPAFVKAARSDPDNAGIAYDMGMLAIWMIRAGDNTVAPSDQQAFMDALKLVQNKRGFYDGQLYCKKAFDQCQEAAIEQRQRLPQLKTALAAAMAAGPELDLQLRTLNDRAAAADKAYRQMQVDKARFAADSKSPNAANNVAACEAGMRHAQEEARIVKQTRPAVERAVAQRNARILQCKKDVDRAEKIIQQAARAVPSLTFRPPAVKGMVVTETVMPGSDNAPPVEAKLIDAIRAAGTVTAAGEAYANARTANARDPQVYRAYIRRLLELGQPRLCTLAAQDLTRLQSEDPLACGVLAYALGGEGKTLEAASLLARAIKSDADNAGIIYNLGMLSVWQSRTSDKSFAPEFIAELQTAIAAARSKSAFAAGAAAAKSAFDKRDAAPRKAAPSAAQPLTEQQKAYYQAQYLEAQKGVDRYRNDKSAGGAAQYRAFELRRQAALTELRSVQQTQSGDIKPDPSLPWQPPAVPKAATDSAPPSAPARAAAPAAEAKPNRALGSNPETQLKMAKMLLANDQKARAVPILQDIVANHGDSDQAKEARELLAKMGL
ncbi:MAG: hypothetical protein LLG01_04875 [Planctomycetaceae bacterium]|nr:hypothetical protein [Planctomycetaceae bacterium]